ncbi:MAG: hypothetical protein ABI129_09330 [Rhodanobacter sp.]
MVTMDNGSRDTGAHEWTASDRAMREKSRFWFEKPATRFIVYFCVFVTSEILVGITLHWIFHII